MDQALKGKRGLLSAVPLHEGQEIDKDRERSEQNRECEVSFAAFALPVSFAIAHDPTTIGSDSSFSTIKEANKAAR